MDRPEMAHFLRAARSRVRPSDVGLEAGHGRRTPGLRREEVAHLATISIDTYTRLEQGRGACPSNTALEGISRALRLGRDERAHLFHLAGHADPPRQGAGHVISPAVLHLLDRMDDTAAFVMDMAGYVLAWNPLAAALVADFSQWAPADRNLTWQVFCGTQGAAATYSRQDWETFARSCVDDLRAANARHPNDPSITSLIQRLRNHSPIFCDWWEEHHVANRGAGRKTLTHPTVGDLELDFDVLLVPHQNLRVIIYSAAPGSAAAASLRLLAVVGTQHMQTAAQRG